MDKKNKIALFPGSFSPIHNGHIAIIKLASTFYNEVIIYVANNDSKEYSVFLKDRKYLVEKVVNDLGLNNVKVVMQKINQVTPLYAKNVNAQIIIRGLRGKDGISPYESLLAESYLDFNGDLEFHYISIGESKVSSTMIRESIYYNKDISEYIPKIILEDVKKLWGKAN